MQQANQHGTVTKMWAKIRFGKIVLIVLTKAAIIQSIISSLCIESIIAPLLMHSLICSFHISDNSRSHKNEVSPA